MENEKNKAKNKRAYSKKPSKISPSLRVFIPDENIKKEIELTKGLLSQYDLDLKKINPVNKIINSDSIKALKKIENNSIKCVITSPPYWNVVDYGIKGQYGHTNYDKYINTLLEIWKQCERVLRPNGKLCIQTPIMPISKKIMPKQHTRHIKNINNDIEFSILNNTGLNRYSLYIWKKQTTEKMFGSYPYPPNLFEQNTIEFINVFVKPGKPEILKKEIKQKSRLTQEQWLNLTMQIWNIYPKDVKRKLHPAPFPEAIPNRLIAMYTFAKSQQYGFEGDIVLDPFCGIGTTCIAAKKLGRQFIGIDLSPDFCMIAVEMLEKVKPVGEIFLCE